MKKKDVSMMIKTYEKLGDFFVDIAKLVFAGVVLSTLLDLTEDKIVVLILGIISTIGLLILGFTFYETQRR